jgi:hypothetical protein
MSEVPGTVSRFRETFFSRWPRRVMEDRARSKIIALIRSWIASRFTRAKEYMRVAAFVGALIGIGLIILATGLSRGASNSSGSLAPSRTSALNRDRKNVHVAGRA